MKKVHDAVAQGAKKPYRQPELKTWGRLTDLTKTVGDYNFGSNGGGASYSFKSASIG